MTDERRTSKRFAIQLNKITGAEITRAGQRPAVCYIYIVDISQGGLRITTDESFEVGEIFGLHLQLQPPLSGKVEVVWKKLLTGGTNVYGVKFVDVSETLSTQIADFIESYSEEAKRRRAAANFNRVLSMQFPEVTGEQKIYALTSILSTDGMQITTETELEPSRQYACVLWLEADQPPIALKARVHEVKAAVFDRYKMSLVFEALPDGAVERINTFLDSVVDGSVAQQGARPEVSFEDP